MTRDEWIAAFAERAGVPGPTVEETRALLELAGTAAHASERTAAPLACWIAGRSGLALEELLDAAAGIGSTERPDAGQP
jgi:hypothetical protein